MAPIFTENSGMSRKRVFYWSVSVVLIGVLTSLVWVTGQETDQSETVTIDKEHYEYLLKAEEMLNEWILDQGNAPPDESPSEEVSHPWPRRTYLLLHRQYEYDWKEIEFTKTEECLGVLEETSVKPANLEEICEMLVEEREKQVANNESQYFPQRIWNLMYFRYPPDLEERHLNHQFIINWPSDESYKTAESFIADFREDLPKQLVALPDIYSVPPDNQLAVEDDFDPIAAGWKRYQDPDGVYLFYYPPDWGVKNGTVSISWPSFVGEKEYIRLYKPLPDGIEQHYALAGFSIYHFPDASEQDVLNDITTYWIPGTKEFTDNADPWFEIVDMGSARAYVNAISSPGGPYYQWYIPLTKGYIYLSTEANYLGEDSLMQFSSGNWQMEQEETIKALSTFEIDQ